MKILFIAPRFHSNQYALIKKLSEQGHKIDFYVMGKGNSEDYTFIKPKLIPISILTKIYIYFFKRTKEVDVFDYASIALPSIRSYYKRIVELNADIIIIRVGNYPYFLMLLPLVLFFRKKVIYYSQQPKYENKKVWKKEIFNKIVSFNYKIPWYSPVLYYGNWNDTKKNNEYISYIPFFCEKKNSSVKIENIIENKEIMFLCVAKYEKRKGIEKLIKAADVLVRKGYRFKLTIIGSTGNKTREDFFLKLQAKVDSLQLGNIVELKKNIPYAKMSKEYSRHQVFILPTTKEPASVSQLEAMSYGLAIICSSDNGTAHYVKNQKNGFLIKPDSDSIVVAMEEYLTNFTLLFEHQKMSLFIVENEMSIDKSCDALLSLI